MDLEQLRKWFAIHRQKIVEDFFSFLMIQSISADPLYKEQCLHAAEFLTNYLEQLGMEVQHLIGPGLPVVFAEHKGSKKAPTVLIYHHYDVQPVDPIELWNSDPFHPRQEGDLIYARGASDNKGQCFSSLIALHAVLDLCKDIDVNIKVFIEGEEESGGQSTDFCLKKYKDLLKADYIFVVDFDMAGPERPAITLGMRGIATFDLELRSADKDLHSGIHGGIALNPNRALATLLAKMWDDKGTIAIEGVYEGAMVLDSEKKSLVDLSFDEKKYQLEFGVSAFCNEDGVGLKESNTLRPTLEINGISGGYSGQGFKTVIPAKASAKISMRLVAGQDPQHIEKCLANFVVKHTPKGVDVKLTALHSAPAFQVDMDSEVVELISRAQEKVYGTKTVYSFCGASVPIVAALAEAAEGQVALFGTSLPTDDFHAPNEHYSIKRLEYGFLMMATLLFDLAGRK